MNCRDFALGGRNLGLRWRGIHLCGIAIAPTECVNKILIGQPPVGLGRVTAEMTVNFLLTMAERPFARKTAIQLIRRQNNEHV